MKLKRSTQFTIRLWLLSLLMQIIAQPLAMALTSGPTQPEFASFSPMDSTDMVDLFTGDFAYNIPLLDVGGYPINLSYNSGVQMDQESSWVGLGWNLSPGSISRQLRGLTDDFNGDEIQREINIADNYTVGIGVHPNLEFVGLGIDSLDLNFSIYYNNYKGIGIKSTISPTFGLGKLSNLGINLEGDSQEGGTISSRLGLGFQTKTTEVKTGIGFGMNTRNGLKGLTLTGYNLIGPTVNFSPWSYRPASALQFNNTGILFRGSLGGEALAAHFAKFINGYYSRQRLVLGQIQWV